MMMALGEFIFDISTIAYQSLQRTDAERFAKGNRTGKRATHQHLGAGDDTITLPGTIYAEIAEDGAVSLEFLRLLKAEGEPVIMMRMDGEGRGYVSGSWVIVSLDETRTYLNEFGAAQKIEFTVKLERHAGDL